MKERETFFAVTTPGLEDLTHRELAALGIPGKTERGGVTFRGTREDLYKANLWLRTAHRILVRVTSFNASSWRELEKGLARVKWERFFHGALPRVKVTSYRSRLYHERAIAERILETLENSLSRKSPERVHPSTLYIRVVEDGITVSIDSSGEHLHKRGYRRLQGPAPVRETLAAAMLMACGWPGDGPLMDPFCGSGTIAIEGATMALGWAPGRLRAFAFQEWADFDPRVWERLLARAAPHPTKDPPPILASDMKGDMVEMARINAQRAGVKEYIQWDCRPFTFLPSLPREGWLVANPPYGKRLDNPKALSRLYANLGKIIKERLTQWNLALLVPPRYLPFLDLPAKRRGPVSNGGMKVWLVVRTIP